LTVSVLSVFVLRVVKKILFKTIEGSVTAPQGFRAGGVFCDIKRIGTGKGSDKGQKRDLALIVSDAPATVAGTFTTNRVCAAPVKLCIQHLKQGQGAARCIVINSGNANACTGQQGLRDAKATAEMGARAVSSFLEGTGRISAREVMVASTGRIGVPLPMENLRRGIEAVVPLIGSDAAHSHQAAEAIMTSDTRHKEVAVEFELAGKIVRVGGICKGAGMIQPGMSPTGKGPALSALHATMLCFLTTDASIESSLLQNALNEAVAKSFNRITVDGDMSTNDTVLVLANGRAGNPTLAASAHGVSKGMDVFQAALDQVTLELAKKIVLDGEGASRFVTVRVRGAKSFADADAAARVVANSSLVKTSWHGGDPNWGRILCALGYSPAELVEEKVDVGYSLPASKEVLYSLKRGRPTEVSFRALCKITAKDAFDLHINLNLGKSSAVIYAADLTENYVDFNKGDVNDPASLGG
jgi:glutamate N-acetyltransferase / amino-acid N-acetyltransferase